MIGKFFKRFFQPASASPAPLAIGPLATATAANLEEYAQFHQSMQAEYARRIAIEDALLDAGEAFTVDGLCYVCRRSSTFSVDLMYNDGIVRKGKTLPNWRERLLCKCCSLNNRIRASVHFLEQNLQCDRDAVIYIAEQTTQLYAHLQGKYPRLIGSEFFGERIPYGSVDPVTGYRNESATALTFGDASLDFMLSFDVYEHVPDYQAALRECYRCLKPGGKLLFTVPFNKGVTETQMRARIDANGNIEHLHDPIYHGDPINPAEGCLCFYIFGWDILQQLRDIGFSKAEAHMYWSREFAYLGEEGILLTAQK